MQRIEPCELTPEQYVEREEHRQVRAEERCPNCRGRGTLVGHGSYGRSVTTTIGRIVVILVARFFCRRCERTVSYLPSFALSYRLVRAATVEAFLDGENGRRDVQRWEVVLRGYCRRMTAFAAHVVRAVGCGLGLSPPREPTGLWPWLKRACGSLAAATRQLVTHYKITVFERHQCHQPTRILKKPRSDRTGRSNP
jgi:hypothetical protein